jgi:hypothetical protein
MARERNGRNGTWKIIATIGGFIVVIIGAAVAYGVLDKTVKDMEPEVKLNSEHRIKFEERVTTMQVDITKILKIMEAEAEAQK